MTSRSSGSRKRRPPLGASYDDALHRAFDQIARRARSEAEVRRKLLQDGAVEPVVDRVVARLHELRYLDDEAFARARARSLAARGFGPLAAASKLALAGVAPHRAKAGVDEAFESERALARQALERRLKGRAAGDLERKEKERLLRWLASRGFSSPAIRAAFEGSIAPD